MQTALITGITGQDGAYLAKLLLSQGFRVAGLHRRTATSSLWRLKDLGVLDRVELFEGEMLEEASLIRLLRAVKPDEVYNLAAQSFVGSSFDTPLFTTNVNALGTARLLEAFREYCPGARFYQASTSEMYGNIPEHPQSETTPFDPQSPYAISKVCAHHFVRNYREAYALHCVSGILFNHESPLRGEDFVTRRITQGLAQVRTGRIECLELGNLAAMRDWGYAADYVEGMTRILRAKEPDDYVLATGESRTVEEFANHAARAAGFDPAWEGEGVERHAIDRASGKTIIKVASERYRPADVGLLRGDASRARQELGWQPETSFQELVEMMTTEDIRRLEQPN